MALELLKSQSKLISHNYCLENDQTPPLSSHLLLKSFQWQLRYNKGRKNTPIISVGAHLTADARSMWTYTHTSVPKVGMHDLHSLRKKLWPMLKLSHLYPTIGNNQRWYTGDKQKTPVKMLPGPFCCAVEGGLWCNSKDTVKQNGSPCSF